MVVCEVRVCVVASVRVGVVVGVVGVGGVGGVVLVMRVAAGVFFCLATATVVTLRVVASRMCIQRAPVCVWCGCCGWCLSSCACVVGRYYHSTLGGWFV